MKHSVTLVQLGINAQTWPVAGKSTKLYGNAVASSAHGPGAVIFLMSLEEYARSAYDLIGNTTAAQQWVPEFKVDDSPSIVSRGLCGIPSGCKLGPKGVKAEAEYRWESNLFCAGHAPNNAKPLYDGASPIWSAPVQPVVEADVQAPIIQKKATDAATDAGDEYTPPETLAPPLIGSEDEGKEPDATRIEKPVPMPEMPKKAAPQETPRIPEPKPAADIQGHIAGAPTIVPPAPEPPNGGLTSTQKAPSGASAAEVIAKAVADGVAAALRPMTERLAGLESKIAAIAQKPVTGKKPGNPNLVPTAFQLLQQQAKSLGINTYGKSKEVLTAEIDAMKAA